MRGLLTADLHVHPHRPLATIENGMNSRLRITLEVLDHMIETVKQEGLDFIAIAGDLFHVSPPFAEAYNWLSKKLTELGQVSDVYLIAGNHDLRQLYYTGDPMDIPFLQFNRIQGVHVLGTASTHADLGGGVTIAGFHHQHLDRLSEQLDVADPADILLLHQSVAEASTDTGFRFPEGLAPESSVFEKFGMVVCGHIHKPQHPSPKFLIPGAPLHLTFGDESERGFWIWTDGVVEWHQTKAPKFITVATEEEAIKDGNFYRVDQHKDAKTERLKLPGSGDAITQYCGTVLEKGKERTRKMAAGLKLVDEIKVDQSVPSDFIIEHVELREFGPFEKVSLDVQSGLNMILGEWAVEGETDPGRSNGAGKSTLFEGICWILYGRTAKGITGADIMRRTRGRGKKCYGELTLSSETRGKMVITRSQSSKSTVLKADLEDRTIEGKKTEVQKELDEILGVSYDFSRQMVYFGQGTAEFFSKLGDADRKELLSTLLRLDWYVAALKESKSRSTKAAQQLGLDEGKLENLITRAKMVAGQVRELKSQAKAWKGGHDERVGTAIVEVSKLESELGKSAKKHADEMVTLLERFEEERKTEKTRIDSEVDGVEASVRATFEKRRKSAQAKVKTDKDRAEASRKTFESLPSLDEQRAANESVKSKLTEAQKLQQSLLAELAALRRDIKSKTEDRDKKRSVLSGASDIEAGTLCTKCGAEVTEETKDSYLAHLQSEVDDLCGEVDSMNTQVTDLNEKWADANDTVVKLNEDIEFDQDKIREIEKAKEYIETTERMHKDSEEALLNLESDLTAAISVKITETTTRHKRETSTLEKGFEGRRSSLLSSQSQLTNLLSSNVDKAKQRLTEVENEECPHDKTLKETQQMMLALDSSQTAAQKAIEKGMKEVDLWSFWVKGFGREGIPAALLEGFCTHFTESANTMLSSLGTGMRVKLSPSTILKSGEVRDRLDYTITTKTGQSSYEQLSGGEKVRVDVVSMLTLHNMAARQYAIREGLFGMLILDEVFSALDPVGCELVYQMLESFDVRSVYVISHSDAMKSLFRSVLMVRNLGDKSIIV